jgi:hypothetical protein
MRPLGETQQAVLKSLSREGFWFDGCGWLWDNRSGTTKIMESLLKRGLVTKSKHTWSNGYTTDRYDLVKEKK